VRSAPRCGAVGPQGWRGRRGRPWRAARSVVVAKGWRDRLQWAALLGSGSLSALSDPSLSNIFLPLLQVAAVWVVAGAAGSLLEFFYFFYNVCRASTWGAWQIPNLLPCVLLGRTTKAQFFVVRPSPGARQRPSDVVWTVGAVSYFVCRAPPATHDKDCSLCMVRESTRQCDFTVQKAVVRPLRAPR
jgi:hypothetical protein